MEITCETLDDLLYVSYKKLLELPFDIKATRGKLSEIFGVFLELKNPQARISLSDTKGKMFSALGELLWYLSASEDLAFIKYYLKGYDKESKDKQIVYGAYGPRFFNSNEKYNQIENIVKLLKNKSTSRKAVIQLFEAKDVAYELENFPEHDKQNFFVSIPCTCSLQFAQRQNKLDLLVFMRSNDVSRGLPHDIFAFTMLQEYIANILGVALGIYKHCVGSFHLYEEDKQEVEDYLSEGRQSTKSRMTLMPKGDPRIAIKTLMELEKKIRLDDEVNIADYELDSYWSQLAYLLQFFKADKVPRDITQMEKIRKFVTDDNYTYILDRKIQAAKNHKP